MYKTDPFMFVAMAILLLFSSSAAAQPDTRCLLTVNVENVNTPRGAIHIALYKDPASFLKEDGVLHGQVVKVTSASKQRIVIEGVEYGRYVLAVFHDLNGNGRLDKNLLGIPSEPYAFGRKEPSKWRDPAFEEIAVPINRQELSVTLPLAYWKDR